MDPSQAYKKCLDEKRRILELEKFIIKDSVLSINYVSKIIKGPWEEGEEIISKHAQCSYFYASQILKKPWEKGEKSISSVAFYSYWYAHDILNDLFYLAHPTIFNSNFKDDYIKFLKSINCDLSEIEEWLI
jgi:hypothetical protein